MLFNVDKLLSLCGFYKQATIETDMAKRIMLSVLPSVMTDTEKFHSGGFDYKALKSAANGVKDLIKYGTAACVEEMQFYGAGIRQQYERITERSITNISEEEFKNFKTIQNKFKNIENVIENVRNLKQNKQYKECLLELVDKFNDVDAWEHAYGGKAWGKIAETLLKMYEKKEMLDLIRQEFATNRDPKTDYLALEVETLREIIVLMNVFDGLAHNNGSVMPKVVQEEFKDLPHSYSNLDEDDEETREIDVDKEIRRVKDLMDAKEINDPFTVYKTLQKIIERPENKHLFGDWIERIKSHPEFAKAKNLKEMRVELDVIKARKKIIEIFQGFDKKLEAIYTLKDQIINTHDETQNKQLIHRLYNETRQLRELASNVDGTLSNMYYYEYKSIAGQLKHIKETFYNSKFKNILNQMVARLDSAKYGDSIYNTDTNVLISDVNNLKKEYRSVLQLADQYLVAPSNAGVTRTI